MKEVKSTVKNLLTEGGGSGGESMASVLLRRRGRKATLARWGLAELPEIAAAFNEQYTAQREWIALHCAAADALSAAILSKQRAIEALIVRFNLRSSSGAERAGEGGSGGSSGGSRRGAGRSKSKLDQFASSAFNKGVFYLPLHFK